MSEEVKNIRLSKAAKEFNIATTTVIEFLTKKGYQIDSNPNSRISEEMYLVLQKEFQSEKYVKEQANQLGLEFNKKKESLSIETVPIKNVAKQDSEEEDLIIKNATLEPKEKKKTTAKKTTKKEEPDAQSQEETIAPPTKTTTKSAKTTTKEEKGEAETELEKSPSDSSEEVVESTQEKKEEQMPVAEQPVQMEVAPEPEPLPEQKIQEPLEEEPHQEKQVPEIVQEAPKEEENKGIKVLGKIDLSTINTKTKPDKKSKKEKTAEQKESPKAEKEQIKNENKEEHQEAVIENLKKPEEIVEPTPETAVVAQQQETVSTEEKDNFIKTEYTKLEGPKLVDQKIDLSQFQKVKKQIIPPSKEDNSAKKKRNRIKSESVDIKAAATTVPAKPAEKNWKKEKHKKEKHRPVEIDASEIEKHIKETLARLSPMGKSKTSKHRREKRHLISQQQQEDEMRMQESQKVLKVTEFVTANELASMMNLPVVSIISTCMTIGMAVSINQRLTAETISLLAEEFGYTVEFVDVDVMEDIKEDETDSPEDLQHRPPIVTVMGHVDHGKTSLLDYIRKANVIAGEAGGITQHIGAYEVQLESGKKITFLDTPGHEAFTAMRARGAKLTDIAIIVIAADDKVMPQTREAINHAQAAGVPIIFAINKIDKPAATPEKIKQELAEMNLLVEEWGGKYQSQDIAAKSGLNVDLLLEKVLLEAELLDLKANPDKRAKGTVVESSLDKGRGYVAKVLIQDGAIAIGDFVLAGHIFGRVKAMYNERNQLVKKAGPSSPVLMLGLNGAPQAGDNFNVMTDEREAKEIANRRLQLQREQGLRAQKHITLDEIGRRIAIGDFKQLNLIVKGDVDGSVEALSASLLKLSTQEVQVNVIHQSVGQITESDVLLASASEAIIIGFQVRPSGAARKLAEQEQIDIRLYSIIYNAIEEIKDAIEGMLSPEIEERIVCNLEIREVFKISKVGSIAGCIVLDGKINRQTKIRIIRDGIVVYTGKLGSLKRFKDDVKEAVSGQDCGLNIENYNDIKVGDIIEGYEQIEKKRTL